MNLDPFRKDAYLELLEEAFLDDHVLSVEESERLRSVLIAYGDGRRTNEQVFKENQKGYEMFAYAAGLAYYYKYEEKDNKKNARSYLKIAAASDSLESKKADRAKRLGLIADYYARIGLMDEAGDASVTYRDYWDDLVLLSAGNLIQEDNERTALVMYEELVNQMISRITEFKEAGVGKEEMSAQLWNIKERLDTDFAVLGGNRQKNIEADLRTLTEHVEKAEKMVLSAYAGEEGQER